MEKLAIHSVPRSGSTWLGTLFDSHPAVSYKFQPLFSYGFKDYLDTSSSNADINDFFKNIADSKDTFLNQIEGKDKGIIPVFNKFKQITHSCYKEVRYHHILENILQKAPDVKTVLLIRNPLATIYSWYKAPKEFRHEKGWSFEDEWLYAPKKNLTRPEEFNGYAKWKEASLLFLKLKQDYSDQVYLVDYKDLFSDTENIIKQLFTFAGLDYPEQTAKFIKESKSQNQKDAYSVFKIKNKDDQWKNLPEDIKTYIYKDLTGTTLERYLDE